MYKMLQVREPTLIRQIEGNKITWLLDGVGKRNGKPLEKLGCKWIRGRPGAWELPDSVATKFIERGVPVIDYESG